MKRALLAAVLVLATACSAEPSAPSKPSGPAVVVEDKFGQSTVDGPVKRVVALDWTSADIAISLGVVPVAMSRVKLGTDTGVQPWSTEQLAAKPAPELFDSTDGDPVEKIASYRPDLILATKDYHIDQSHGDLSEVAPVIAYRNAPNSDTWEETTRLIAKALGKQKEGEDLIAGTQKALAEKKKTLAASKEKTYDFFVLSTTGSVFVINSTQDVTARTFSALGLSLDPRAESLKTSSIPGRAEISDEAITELSPQRVFATGPPSALEKLPKNAGFAALPAVRNGRYQALPATLAQALAFPSPMSLRWALPKIT